jgi:hypothetical protein
MRSWENGFRLVERIAMIVLGIDLGAMGQQQFCYLAVLMGKSDPKYQLLPDLFA